MALRIAQGHRFFCETQAHVELDSKARFILRHATGELREARALEAFDIEVCGLHRTEHYPWCRRRELNSQRMCGSVRIAKSRKIWYFRLPDSYCLVNCRTTVPN